MHVRVPATHLPDRLTLRDAFRFPVASKEARKDLLIGGCLLICLLVIGWILNLGNRLNVVSRLSAGERPYFRGFRPWGYTFVRGCISFATISSYLAPSAACALLAWRLSRTGAGAGGHLVAALAAGAFVLGVFTLPGCMTVYAVEGHPSVLRRPLAAFERAWRCRRTYLFAWWIALVSVALSLLGLLAAGVGFFFTSVWAWDVVGYAFTVAMYSEERTR
jgi:hypothetical protein